MTSFGFHTTGAEVVERHKEVARGKIIVITGASTNGLGAATAISLAHASPSQLILLGRSIDKVEPVIDEIAKIDANIVVEFVSIELDNANSVAAAAERIKSIVPQIDILINNAGIMAVPYTVTAAGIESQFAVNHIGHFIFTNLLLDTIKRSEEGARIVNLTSAGYKLGPVRFDDWNFSNGETYHEWLGYGQSKTANILFTRYLAKHLAKDGVTSYAVHPGAISGTGLADDMDHKLFETLDEVCRKSTGYGFEIKDWKNIDEGISTTLVAALDPQLTEHSGAYLQDCAVVEPERDYASSDENAEKLWRLSEEITGQKHQI